MLIRHKTTGAGTKKEERFLRRNRSGNLLFNGACGILSNVPYLGVAQLVARYLGVVEAVGSSPVTQTRFTGCFGSRSVQV